MLRVATLEDAPGIARVHVESWKTTYAGLMPESILANLSLEKRTQNMERFLRSQPEHAVTIVTEEDGCIVGFAQCGLNRDLEMDPAFAGELYGIYLLKEWQHQGLGKQLVKTASRFLLSHALKSMIVWALASNQPACRFYAALGGSSIREREIEIQGQRMLETSYGWNDLRRLAS
ncbi:sortase [Longilinea arvoryzae]|uniref:Sortase n=1 Tax=Longilinea arvoryzae TaxID=360412 RepID=A0A0S7BJD6_9CHLR|nr:GNAT family N-acetyltransferase [Longilinea arvoryzae]GAP13754.1 sortase [Longilinea arvoryzae]